ncbi:MAG: cytochrome c biogenesis protein CcdA [Chloroflexota bacterium]
MNGPGALFLAFGAGIISFLSPCTLPLLPGYLSYISGLGAEEVQARQNAHLVVGAAALFVLGFSLIFVALGATMSYLGSIVAPHRDLLSRVAGVFIIVMALAMMGVFRVPVLYQEKRIHLTRDWGVWSAFPLGMAFAFGWSPCIGPVLTSILGVAATEGSVQRGALLLFVYSLGLGLPFLAMALFASRMFYSLGWFKRHYRALNVSGGAILLVMGTFLVMDRWTELLAPIMRWYGQLNLPT